MERTPVVTIFVRHSADCPRAGDEFYKGCKCRKHLRWFANGKQHRLATKSRSWAEAEDRKRELELNLSGKALPANSEAKRKNLTEAIASFLDSKRSQGLNQSVMKKYERELGRMREYMAARNKFVPSQIGLDDLIAFRSTWEEHYPSATTRQKVQERLRGFLRYCYEAKHIDRVPTLSPIKAKDVPTLPLTEKEYKRLLETIPKAFTSPHKAARIHALVRLMRHSGLSIRDAVTLERSEIQLDEEKKRHRIVTARQKTGTHVSVLIPNDVAEELLRVANGNPRYLFWTGNGQPETAVKDWHHIMRRLFDKAGMPQGHPHQLRDTFAVDCLDHDVSMENLSKLLGHTSTRTTEKHYAPWMKSRQNRLDADMLRITGAGK